MVNQRADTFDRKHSTESFKNNEDGKYRVQYFDYSQNTAIYMVYYKVGEGRPYFIINHRKMETYVDIKEHHCMSSSILTTALVSLPKFLSAARLLNHIAMSQRPCAGAHIVI